MKGHVSNSVFLGTGSNIGNRLAILKKTFAAIQDQLGDIKNYSSIYETAAWGITDQQAFLNQVIEIQTPLSPEILMEKILQIEKSFGRVRDEKWGPRNIDIDILFFNAEILQTALLQIPHPQIAFRKFVLVPMAEIAPDFQHPELQISMSTMLLDCEDTLEIKMYNGN